MYYVLKCLDPVDKYLARISHKEDDPFRSWLSGEAFDKPPESPLIVNVTSDKQTIWAEMWETPLPVMSKRLYEILNTIGVNNIETYQAILSDPFNQVESKDDYLAFNIIGTVSALDLHNGITPINKTAPKDIFRLQESISTLVVSENIRKAIEKSQIKSLSFFRPENWLDFVPSKN